MLVTDFDFDGSTVRRQLESEDGADYLNLKRTRVTKRHKLFSLNDLVRLGGVGVFANF